MARARRKATPAQREPGDRNRVWLAAGRFCYDHEERVWEVGYVSSLPGIAADLFLGKPGAATAQITFAAEPVRANVFSHWLETLSRPSRLTLYQQDPPRSTYGDLASFQSREPIGIFERYSVEPGKVLDDVEDLEMTVYVFTATLIWSRIFELNGEIYDLREMVTAPIEQRFVGTEIPLGNRRRLPPGMSAAETEPYQAIMPFIGQARLKRTG